MVNYSNSVIYKLCCKDVNIKDIYVGSTTNFGKRRTIHKIRSKESDDAHHQIPVYKFIRENGGWDNWDMIEVERYSGLDKQDLCKRERYHIERLESTLNCYKRPGIDKSERNNIRRKKRVQCNCGVEMRYDKLKYHLTTDRHKNRMNNLL